MSNLSQFGPSRWITNPKHLPLLSIPGSLLFVKTDAATANNAGASAFYSAIANRGAQTSITVADTYVTVANLSGAGFLFSCVSPTHSASATPTIRITVDGQQYTIAPSAAQAAGKRLVLGAMIPGYSTNATAAVGTDLIGPNTYADSGIGATAAPVGGVGSIVSGGNISIPSPEWVLAYNLAALRFETSCLIEMKCSLLSGTAVDKQCGATYRLDV